MKTKFKHSEQLYHETVALPLSQLVKQTLENDKYLDNVEAKIIRLQTDSAVIELAFSRNGVKTAAQRVTLSQRDQLSSDVSVYPIYTESQQRSWYFPIAFMLILALTLSASIRVIQSNFLALGLSLLVLGVFAYLGARYLEENSGKLIEYNEEDARLLLNMLKLSLLTKDEEKRKTGELPQPDLAKIEPARPAVKQSPEFRLEDMEAATLDDETLLERKVLHSKLEDLD